MTESKQQIWLMRHGETEWSKSGAHTGRTDLPLTPEGEKSALALRERLAGRQFALVLTSPMRRALDTCRLAGYGEVAQITDDLREWDYGGYEGLSTPQIRQRRPDWNLWKDGVVDGETVQQVGTRARRVVRRVLSTHGDVAIFAHGHILRILAAIWLGLPAHDGRLFALGTGTISVLGYERETAVIQQWNC